MKQHARQHNKMKLVAFIFYSILTVIESSKCPESKKPHSTSCTVFYNCVNLPSGGYVWVPSKCTEGLIFQPYLRICVLPGDSWECDTLSTESSVITNRYDIPELINQNETSYVGLTEDPWNLSELIDSSYTTDSIPDYSDQETVTPYPLIEFAEIMEHESNMDNASEVNDKEKKGHLQTQDDKKYYSMLNQLIHHLLVYKKITIPLELLASSTSSSSSSSTPSRLVTNLPLNNYLVQNYIQQNNNLQNNIITGMKLHNTTESSTTLKNNVDDTVLNAKDSSVFDNVKNENSIILITDNLGNKQYLTVERYKSLAYQLDQQYVQLIPCTKNIRMPNITNCAKYYVCEPEMASVIEYSCPLFTAFNTYARTCDTESYNKCIENKDKGSTNSTGSTDNIIKVNVPDKNICTEHGKTKDITSESRYYICYSASDGSQIKSIRMTCPNDLIFCQTNKVCMIKSLCKTT